MTAGNYRARLDHVLKWEGGYVDHPRDPGGATNHGITQATLAAHRGRAVSKQDVRDLTVAEAGEIYRLKYWSKVKGDYLPDGMDLVAFDGGVNSGPSRRVAFAGCRRVLALPQMVPLVPLHWKQRRRRERVYL